MSASGNMTRGVSDAVMFASRNGEVCLLNSREMKELSRHGYNLREDFLSFVKDTSCCLEHEGHTYYGSEEAIAKLALILRK